MLADGGITFVWVGGILLLGFLGFFVMVIAVLGRFVRSVIRALAGKPWQGGAAGSPAGGRAERICQHPRCGHLNPGDARYCGRCGSNLGPPEDVDHYG